jgi:A/G-specific adenine glycosylase
MPNSRLSPRAFQKKVLAYYKKYGRHELPWRKTRDPYHILVSEVMLQQTQVDRVIPYYERFLNRFPSLSLLAHAPLRDVLAAWSGLGYNRRAGYLHAAAKLVVKNYDGVFPKDEQALLALPGIGPATASGIRTFAYGLPSLYLETNVRSVFLHEFFPSKKQVADEAIKECMKKMLPSARYRAWYYALLDYGVMLKKSHVNPNRRSKHYARQKPFKGSRRELRGKIIRLLLQNKSMTLESLARLAQENKAAVGDVLEALQKEKMLALNKKVLGSDNFDRKNLKFYSI